MRPTWNDNEHGGVIAIHDQGDFTGAIVTTARVVQGGNGLWTPIVSQSAKGRLKRVGRGRVASKHLGIYWPGQVLTREEAIQLCESEFDRLIEMTQGTDSKCKVNEMQGL